MRQIELLLIHMLKEALKHKDQVTDYVQKIIKCHQLGLLKSLILKSIILNGDVLKKIFQIIVVK